jgi:copper homeostasis protein
VQDHLLEVIACSVEDAVAAQDGGAHRLEVISRFDVGGLTPPLRLVEEIADRVSLPLRVMLRETEDFRVADEAERQRLCAFAAEFDALGVDGLVCGFLADGAVDHALLARVMSAAPRTRFTFHRAFEELADPAAAIAELKRYPRLDLILTSGGALTLPEKIARLVECERAARPEITILAGGGMDAATIRALRARTDLRQFHVGTAVRAGNSVSGPVEAARVRALIADCFSTEPPSEIG